MGLRDLPAIASMEGPTRMDEAQLRAELERPWSRTWVARECRTLERSDRADSNTDDDVPVGYLLTWHVADELHVMNVATRPDRRRRGIARALMNEALAYARGRAIKHVLLEVRRSNAPAIALYRAFGFFAMGLRTRYYADDEDAVEMVLLLDPATGAIVAHEDEVRLEGPS
jgi:ribosomal-protein-alanine N-acetyltransferase